MEMVLPLVMIILSLTASIVYLYCGMHAKAIYWFAAGVLNTSVMFMK